MKCCYELALQYGASAREHAGSLEEWYLRLLQETGEVPYEVENIMWSIFSREYAGVEPMDGVS